MHVFRRVARGVWTLVGHVDRREEERHKPSVHFVEACLVVRVRVAHHSDVEQGQRLAELWVVVFDLEYVIYPWIQTETQRTGDSSLIDRRSPLSGKT